MKKLILLASLGLAACDPVPQIPPAQIADPEPRLMTPSPALKDIPKGAGVSELAKDNIQCRVAYGRETAKLRLLQEYQTTVKQGSPP